MTYNHIPVMPIEVTYYLNCKPGKIYVDCTLGGSGHARAILEQIIPDGVLIGIDRDRDSIKNAEKVLKTYALNIHLFHDNFVNLPAILSQLGIASVDGILLDLGISLHHFENSGRGFSFKRDEPLDMRMNTEESLTAEQIVNQRSEKDLCKIFREYGEERWAARIARKIVGERQKKKISSSLQLAQIVTDAVPKDSSRRQRIHPATRVFMALRIVVNRELDLLRTFLENAVDLLNPKGRLCILSFHSLEDRIIKQRTKGLEKGCTCPPDFPKCICGREKIIHSLIKKVKRPAKEEIIANPMARSAKLRALEKI